jgi:serine/threonine protein kinase
MTTDTRVPDLLQRWHELRQQGQTLSAEELCRDCPELIDEVQRQLPTLDVGRETASLAPPPPQPDTNTRPEPSTSSMELPPFAQLVEGYTLVAELGRGGFGQVWKATGPGGFPLAMKFVRLDQRLASVELRSLELMQNLRHPHLLSLFGAWQKDDWLIVAMELADRTLFQRLEQCQQEGHAGIPPAELLRFMQEAAKGLDYLNDMSVQHRDIKPANLLLVGGGIKLADFGLAKLLENSIASNTGAMTPAYAAPEFLEEQTSAKSDQYALAVSYCELRGGRLPFAGNLAQILDGHRAGKPDLSMLPTPSEQAAVSRALAKDPAGRWPNCAAFVAALNAPATASNPNLALPIPALPAPTPTVDELPPAPPLPAQPIIRAEAVTERESPYLFEPVEVKPAADDDATPVRPRKKKKKRRKEVAERPDILGYVLWPFLFFGEVVSWVLGFFFDMLRELPPRITGLMTMLVIIGIVCLFLWARGGCKRADAEEWRPVSQSRQSEPRP